ncbi:DUF4350 domain-containing protein [Marinactinospora thermotolerans]|uniref:DUF4350 domain-containing protein n=1 Tax=Marinactinospora thermotolerans TaxID=531310 RepID=UPI003D8D5EE7
MAPPPTVTSTSAADLWRRVRGPLGFLLALTVIAVVLSLGSRPYPQGDLDPDSPVPEGARALAEVLRERGGEVTIARDTAEAVESLGPGTVLILTQSHRLLPEELDRLAAAPGDRLLVQPTTAALEALAPGVAVSGRVEAGTLSPRCGLPAARAAGPADAGGELYAVEEGLACYPAPEGAALVRSSGDGGTVTVLGTGAPLRNSHLDREGNAALALNLVGGRDVVWLHPDVPVAEGDATLWELLPQGIRLSVWPLAFALALLALWRGRRLGPLVAERLPVVVRASETTEGRAGLYAARRARDRAAAALRAGFLDRVRPLLGLNAASTPQATAEALAERTGESPDRLLVLLYGDPADESGDPHSVDDAALVRLADELDRIEGSLR